MFGFGMDSEYWFVNIWAHIDVWCKKQVIPLPRRAPPDVTGKGGQARKRGIWPIMARVG